MTPQRLLEHTLYPIVYALAYRWSSVPENDVAIDGQMEDRLDCTPKQLLLTALLPQLREDVEAQRSLSKDRFDVHVSPEHPLQVAVSLRTQEKGYQRNPHIVFLPVLRTHIKIEEYLRGLGATTAPPITVHPEWDSKQGRCRYLLREDGTGDGLEVNARQISYRALARLFSWRKHVNGPR